MMTTRHQNLTEPLATVTAGFGAMLLFTVTVGALLTLFRSNVSFMGLGQTPVCAPLRSI